MCRGWQEKGLGLRDRLRWRNSSMRGSRRTSILMDCYLPRFVGDKQWCGNRCRSMTTLSKQSSFSLWWSTLEIEELFFILCSTNDGTNEEASSLDKRCWWNAAVDKEAFNSKAKQKDATKPLKVKLLT
ncbi:hypothetical protein ZIOFF_015662 [Zingiber officinale]|uniref:Uncharacterized protein n=1 Tax=Zingiber officinale TaxID=94328 RepID=A0A8J5HDA2_ZINOF|nr:hypothetical protein ZIOFF_015662 [Zingiber officinale]